MWVTAMAAAAKHSPRGHIQMADEVNTTAFRIRGCENLRPQGRIVG